MMIDDVLERSCTACASNALKAFLDREPPVISFMGTGSSFGLMMFDALAIFQYHEVLFMVL